MTCRGAMFAYRACAHRSSSALDKDTFPIVRFSALTARPACRAQPRLRGLREPLRTKSRLAQIVLFATGIVALLIGTAAAQTGLPAPTLPPTTTPPPQFGAPLQSTFPAPGTGPVQGFAPPSTAVLPENVPAVTTRRIRVIPRSDVPVQLDSAPSPTTGETVTVITNGVNILIDGLPTYSGPLGFAGSIDVSADRIVVWSGQGLNIGAPTVQPSNAPLEMYMEGNIVFREGDRVVQAKAMYYNVQQRNGVILDAELLTPVPRYQGLVRLKAEVLRQVDRDRFVAQHASLTTSRLGIPTYEFKSGALTMEDQQVPAVNPLTGQPQINPQTGEPMTDHDQLVTAQNNVITIEGVPVFYWPWFAGDLNRPPLYLNSFAYRHDNVFGNQVLVDFNPYEILGIRHPPQGTNWTVSLDYLELARFRRRYQIRLRPPILLRPDRSFTGIHRRLVHRRSRHRQPGPGSPHDHLPQSWPRRAPSVDSKKTCPTIGNSASKSAKSPTATFWSSTTSKNGKSRKTKSRGLVSAARGTTCRWN